MLIRWPLANQMRGNLYFKQHITHLSIYCSIFKLSHGAFNGRAPGMEAIKPWGPVCSRRRNEGKGGGSHPPREAWQWIPPASTLGSGLGCQGAWACRRLRWPSPSVTIEPLGPTIFWMPGRNLGNQSLKVLGETRSKPVQSIASSASHTSDWLKGHLIAIKHLGHTLLALCVLMCPLQQCNTALSSVMHLPSARAWCNLHRYCIMCTLKHIKPAKCVLNITSTSEKVSNIVTTKGHMHTDPTS